MEQTPPGQLIAIAKKKARECRRAAEQRFRMLRQSYLSLFGNCKPNDGINCGLGSLKDAKKTVSDSKGGFGDSLEQFMRRLFVIVTAMAAIATVSGCMGNANPGQNPRPGWTEWDRARDNDKQASPSGY